MGRRFISDWVCRGFRYGILLLLSTPILGRDWSSSMLAILLRLPGYLVHLFQQHDDGRLLVFVNRTLGKAKELLTPLTAFMISIPESGMCRSPRQQNVVLDSPSR